MKKSRIVILLIAVLAAVTAALGVLRNNETMEIPEGSIVLKAEGKTEYITLKELDLTDVNGTVVNGKGEEKTVDGRGASLAQILRDREYTGITVTSDDAYSAELSAGETENAFLVIQDDSVTLYVFGDCNSKRNVRNVAEIETK